MKSALLLAIRGYQFVISPLLGQNCRFYPTCSNYALEAIYTHGAGKGSWLAARRLCKCHPWHAGGVDLVPPKGSANSANPANETTKSDCATEKLSSDPISVAGHSSNLS
ncbi:MAG: membrane protein insertion efficiency factor YidD [Burkholderiaceae bacterium]|nr:membrane protein insertion efficiency factor YidD [Burkholderiaceae bacterium]